MLNKEVLWLEKKKRHKIRVWFKFRNLFTQDWERTTGSSRVAGKKKKFCSRSGPPHRSVVSTFCLGTEFNPDLTCYFSTVSLEITLCGSSCCRCLSNRDVLWKCETKKSSRGKRVNDFNSLSRISPTNGSLSLSRISHNAKGSCGVSGRRRSIIEMV